jgi:hypothetical protein
MRHSMSDHQEFSSQEGSCSPQSTNLSHNKTERVEPALPADVQLLRALEEEIDALQSEIRALLQRRRNLKRWRQWLLAQQAPPKQPPSP